MALFQTSVLKRELEKQDKLVVEKAYKRFKKYFFNSTIQQNIRESKEEQFQEGFLRELFVNVLGYTINPSPNFNLTTEFKNLKGAKKADGAILAMGHAPLTKIALAVIELKSTKVKNLEEIRVQAFDYKSHHPTCKYVITSTFDRLRFYIENSVDYEEFDLFTITPERFDLLYFCLSKENLTENMPLQTKEASVIEEEKVTKKLYADYSLFKREIFRDIVKRNMNKPTLRELTEKDIKKTLFKKTQKLLDRFLFIFFAEDRGLLPPNSISQIIDKWQDDVAFGEDKTLYEIYKSYFHVLNVGRAKQGKRQEIFAYNGGLFKPDAILDALEIDNDLLLKHTATLTKYDFETDVDVNILGHIFENSLNEIESINAEIEGVEFDKQKTKRKKDGVFYTPKYITKYIVDNTIGKLCEEKRTELEINDDVYLYAKQRSKKRIDNLEEYRKWLLQLTICDPACGSGAFLNQALDFLIKEHAYIDELTAKYHNVPLVLSNIENSILENNIYGVDLNEESVEIAKLSLWLRTAQKGRKLTSLSSNIKCGNSLIDSKAVAGDKAFNWQEEFPTVFQQKEKKIWHVTTATHNSRYSQRMFDNHVKTGEAIWLDKEDEVIITKTIAEIVKERKLDNNGIHPIEILEYNICGDHMHLLIVCEAEELPGIVKLIKGRTARMRNSNKGINPLVRQNGEKAVPLWTQKFGKSEVKDEEYLRNAIEYIRNNRVKHELPEIPEINKLKKEFLCSLEQALKTEYKGGFDVVIGNPPYVRMQSLKEHYPEHTIYYEKTFQSATGNYDIYALFMEKSFSLIEQKGIVSFILPHKFLISDFGSGIRSFFVNNTAVSEIIHFGSEMVFDDASTYTCIINLSKINKQHIKFKHLKPSQLFDTNVFSEVLYSSLNNDQWILADKSIDNVLKKIQLQPLTLKDVFTRFVQGIITGKDAVFCIKGNIKGDFLEIIDDKGYISKIEKEILKPHLRGEDVNKFRHLDNNEWLIFPYQLINGKAELIEPNILKTKYPNTLEYLRKYEDILREREKGKFNNEYWYQYSRNQAISVLEQPKIITPEVCFGGSMTYDENNFYHNSKCHTLLLNENTDYTYKSILPILNSSLFWFYLSNTGNILRGGYIGVKRKVLEPFSIPSSENINKKQFELFTDYMLNRKAQIQLISKKFTNYIQSQYKIEKLTKKLENWHELEFADFIKELNKAIKKTKGINPLGIEKLSKIDEFEWLELFENKKAEAQKLKAEIEKTDKEIDQMVYELYGLTEEEIKIVEGGL